MGFCNNITWILCVFQLEMLGYVIKTGRRWGIQVVGSKLGHAGAGQPVLFAVECLMSLTNPLFILNHYFLLTKVADARTTIYTLL